MKRLDKRAKAEKSLEKSQDREESRRAKTMRIVMSERRSKSEIRAKTEES